MLIFWLLNKTGKNYHYPVTDVPHNTDTRFSVYHTEAKKGRVDLLKYISRVTRLSQRRDDADAALTVHTAVPPQSHLELGSVL